MDIAPLYEYFKNLSDKQREQFEALAPLYSDWNAKINVISRKDIDNLYINHVVHSLVIAKFLGPLQPGTSFLDMGTGGGFPGIPLAIYYPECTFHLIDRIGKKIRVAQEIAASIGLQNVTFQHGDIGECRQKFNYVVSRAVMPLNELVPLIRKNVCRRGDKSCDVFNTVPNGLICLKGGDLKEEKAGYEKIVEQYPVTQFLPDPHYDEKYIVYIPIK